MALAFKLDLSQILVLMKSDLRVLLARTTMVITVFGLNGLPVLQHAAVEFNKDDVNTAAVTMTLFKNVLAITTLAHGDNGLLGPTALSAAVVVMLFDNGSIRVLAKLNLTLNSVIPIHVHTMVPGLIGVLAQPVAVLEQ